MVHDIERTHQRTLACAGDFWANFKWGEFLRFHEQQDTPVSILVGPSVPTFEGARFRVKDNGVVSGWERVDHTTEQDLINIGAYIVDPEKLVMKKLREMTWHKEDPFNDAMIAGGLMSAYVLNETAYNVNNPQVYAALVQNTTVK
jgi:NDP-sugar pyrophosphorylase family protein